MSSIDPVGGPNLGPGRASPSKTNLSSLIDPTVDLDRQLSNTSDIQGLLKKIGVPMHACNVLMFGVTNRYSQIANIACDLDRCGASSSNKQTTQLGLIFLAAGARTAMTIGEHRESAFTLGHNIIDCCRLLASQGSHCASETQAEEVVRSYPEPILYSQIVKLADSMHLSATSADLLAAGLIDSRRAILNPAYGPGREKSAQTKDIDIAAIGDLFLAQINEELDSPLKPLPFSALGLFRRSHEVGKAVIDILLDPHRPGWDSRVNVLSLAMRSSS